MRSYASCLVVLALQLVLSWPYPVLATERLCSGEVCAVHITRSAKNHWELRLRLRDKQGQHALARLDCRSNSVTGDLKALDVAAIDQLAQRACRLLPRR